jgi:hypothetical protein
MQTDDTRCKRQLESATVQRHRFRVGRSALGLLLSQHVDIRPRLDENTNTSGVAAIRGEVKGGVSAGKKGLERSGNSEQRR